MFKLKKETKFMAKVTVYEPGNGTHIEGSFKAHFKIVCDDEIPKGDTLLDHALISVDDIELGEGITQEQVLVELKRQPHIAAALRTAYSAAVVKKNMGSLLSM